MINIAILLSGVILFVTVIMVLDAIGRRRRRNAGKN